MAPKTKNFFGPGLVDKVYTALDEDIINNVPKELRAKKLVYNFEQEQNVQIVAEHSLLIFDWDDTLLATSWLCSKGLGLETLVVPQKAKEELDVLDSHVSQLLRKALFLYGKVVILTNGQEGWVERSSQLFLPETYEFLFQSSSGSEVLVISAREQCESRYPNNPTAWKVASFGALLKDMVDPVFLETTDVEGKNRSGSFDGSESTEATCFSDIHEMELGEPVSDSESLAGVFISQDGTSLEIDHVMDIDSSSFYSFEFEINEDNEGNMSDFEDVDMSEERVKPQENGKPVCNLLAFGDSLHDCLSLRVVIPSAVNCIRKTVKFASGPNIKRLIKEIQILDNNLENLCLHPVDVDVAFESSVI